MTVIFNLQSYPSIIHVFNRLVPTIHIYKENEFALTRIMIDISQTVNSITEGQDRMIKEFYINLILSMFKDTVIADKEVNRYIIESVINYHTSHTEVPMPFFDYEDYIEEDNEVDSEDDSAYDSEDDSAYDSEEDITVRNILGEEYYEDSDDDEPSVVIKVIPQLNTITNPEIDYTCVITGDDCSKTGGYIINKHNDCEPKVILSEESFPKKLQNRLVDGK